MWKILILALVLSSFGSIVNPNDDENCLEKMYKNDDILYIEYAIPSLDGATQIYIKRSCEKNGELEPETQIGCSSNFYLVNDNLQIYSHSKSCLEGDFGDKKAIVGPICRCDIGNVFYSDSDDKDVSYSICFKRIEENNSTINLEIYSVGGASNNRLSLVLVFIILLFI